MSPVSYGPSDINNPRGVPFAVPVPESFWLTKALLFDFDWVMRDAQNSNYDKVDYPEDSPVRALKLCFRLLRGFEIRLAVTSNLAQSTVVQRLAEVNLTEDFDNIRCFEDVAAITARQVDFGASDAPLSPEQLQACNGCVQIPWALSATAVIYNLKGVPNNLHLTGAVLARIYLGQLRKWNDPAIRALNPKISLPATDITPVYRSDNSGTTYNFTDYLSAVSPDWKKRIGRGVNANWPAGQGGRGSSGVAGIVSNTQGALGYVDVAFALK